MQTKLIQYRAFIRIITRAALCVCVVLGCGVQVGWAQSRGTDPVESVGQIPIQPVNSIPAPRKAERIVVITVEGAIDRITAMSVIRRIEASEQAGFDAMVLEINSPGGELGAVLEISNAIKSSSITNTVAWVNADAYSGGAIIALACNEIVTSSPASMGDAFIIQMGPTAIRGLSPDERTKFLPPLMADVTDSARRSGFDEYLVQAIVVDGVELWYVENNTTGQRMAINESEYRMLFGDEVVRGKPILAEVTGGIKTYRTEKDTQTEDEIVEEGDEASDKVGDEIVDEAVDETPGETSGPSNEADAIITDDPSAYRPASETLKDIAGELAKPELAPESVTNRPAISGGDYGQYRLLGYITDGSAAIVMRDDQLAYFGFSSGIVDDDEDLKAFFGAEKLVRINESVTERMVRVLVSPAVRFFLIVVLLIAVFVEMIMAGTGIAGAIALGALVLILGPPAMIGLSGWWELIAIGVGVICLAVEAFIIPGFGVFGVVGFVALFGGLIGTFVSAGGSMSNPNMQRDLMTGSVTVLLAFITAGIGWWLIVRNAQNLPLFDRLILSGASGVGGIPKKSMLHAIVPDDGSVRVGDEGVTTTPLYPSGQAEIDGEIVDVAAGFGYIDRGIRVRVVSVRAMRIEVEPMDDGQDSHDGRASEPTDGVA